MCNNSDRIIRIIADLADERSSLKKELDITNERVAELKKAYEDLVQTCNQLQEERDSAIDDAHKQNKRYHDLRRDMLDLSETIRRTACIVRFDKSEKV